jgi:hypothetical protein
MGLDAGGTTRYRRCARLRHLSVATRATNASSRKSFSRFLSRSCHADRGCTRRRVSCTRHRCVARRHRRHRAVHVAALRDGCACGRPRGVEPAGCAPARARNAAPEFARASRRSRAFAGCVCADLHIRATPNGIGPTNRANPTLSTRARSSLRRVLMRSTFGYVYKVVKRPRCRASVRACERARHAHAERRVRASARCQYRVRMRFAHRRSARRVTNGA